MNGQVETAERRASENYVLGNADSVFCLYDVKISLWPILATIGLGFLIFLPSAVVNGWMLQRIGPERADTLPWVSNIVNHTVMLIISLVLLTWLSKRRPFEYGLRWPESRSYIRPALIWGVCFGILMTVVDYFPQIVAHVPPPDNLQLTPVNIAGWFFFEWFYVGPTEEIPFRGLLLTFLMQRVSGRVRFFRFDMHIAGVILAVLFALAHMTSFWSENFLPAVGQQFYGFTLGIIYAYWREKSGSLLAPIMGHNVSDGVEYSLMFLMTWLWG